jgi:hypothetical protein
METNADLPPARVALPGQIVEVDRLMRAVEAADSDMDDSGNKRGTVVCGHGDTISEGRQGGFGERIADAATAELQILHNSPLPQPAGAPEEGASQVGSAGRAHDCAAKRERESRVFDCCPVPPHSPARSG